MIIKNTLFAIVAASSTALLASDVTSQTFFRPRSLTDDGVLEYALSKYRLNHSDYEGQDYDRPEHKSMLATQSNWFYQESTNDEDLAKYFLFNNQTSLSVKQDGSGNIGSVWIDLINNETPFTGSFSIQPKRKIYGSIMNWHYDFSQFANGAWMNVLIPVARAEFDLNLEDCNEVEGTGISQDCETIKTVRQALNISEKCFGKLHCDKRSKSGVDDIQVKLGFNFKHTPTKHFAAYLLAQLGMGERPTAEFLFEPLLGSVHSGLGVGIDFECEFAHWGKHKLSLLADAKYVYKFSGTERRSFDLARNGNWSRYLQVVKRGQQDVTQQGINFFTQDLKVEPRGTVDVWTALHYAYSKWNLEAGYDFWWRESERVALREHFDAGHENIGIADLNAIHVGGNPVSASNALICQGVGQHNENIVPSDSTFVNVGENDFNLKSAAHKSAMSHKIFGGISYHYNAWDCPALIGLGGSFEFADSNKALEQWAVWLKTGISF